MTKKKQADPFWAGATITTGAHLGKDGVKTAKTIGRSGAWTLKSRRRVGVRVGCIFIDKSDNREELQTKAGRVPSKSGMMVAASHAAVCDHHSVKGARSRKLAIAQTKKSDEWCALCDAELTKMASV